MLAYLHPLVSVSIYRETMFLTLGFGFTMMIILAMAMVVVVVVQISAFDFVQKALFL
jgi:hypothetical protein